MLSLGYFPIFTSKHFLITSFRSSQILEKNINHNVLGHSYPTCPAFFFNLAELEKLHLSSNLHKVPKSFSSPIAAQGLNESSAIHSTRSLLW